jgi:hypothetical protein
MSSYSWNNKFWNCPRKIVISSLFSWQEKKSRDGSNLFGNWLLPPSGLVLVRPRLFHRRWCLEELAWRWDLHDAGRADGLEIGAIWSSDAWWEYLPRKRCPLFLSVGTCSKVLHRIHLRPLLSPWQFKAESRRVVTILSGSRDTFTFNELYNDLDISHVYVSLACRNESVSPLALKRWRPTRC